MAGEGENKYLGPQVSTSYKQAVAYQRELTGLQRAIGINMANGLFSTASQLPVDALENLNHDTAVKLVKGTEQGILKGIQNAFSSVSADDAQTLLPMFETIIRYDPTEHIRSLVGHEFDTQASLTLVGNANSSLGYFIPTWAAYTTSTATPEQQINIVKEGFSQLEKLGYQPAIDPAKMTAEQRQRAISTVLSAGSRLEEIARGSELIVRKPKVKESEQG